MRGIPNGDVFKIICGELPDRKLDKIAGPLGPSNIEPICGGGEPPPEAAALLDPIAPPTGKSDNGGKEKAWLLLFEGRYSDAIGYARQAESTSGESKGRKAQALALMLDGKSEDARKLFDNGRGTFVLTAYPERAFKNWEQEVIDDFKELREAGFSGVLMNEVEREYGSRIEILRQLKALLADTDRLLNEKKFDNALIKARELSAYANSLVFIEPANQAYSHYLGVATATTGEILMQMDRTSDAEECFRKAIDIFDGASNRFKHGSIFLRDAIGSRLLLANLVVDKREVLDKALNSLRELELDGADGSDEMLTTVPRLFHALSQLDVADRKAAEKTGDWRRALAVQHRILARDEYAGVFANRDTINEDIAKLILVLPPCA